jgi:hypothetical protein
MLEETQKKFGVQPWFTQGIKAGHQCWEVLNFFDLESTCKDTIYVYLGQIGFQNQ